jgi:hypothetical protein
MGGLPQWERGSGQSDVDGGETIKTFWPGQFFYRSGGEFFIANPTNMQAADYGYIWDWPYNRVNRYILGGYGSPRTDGDDIIRLTAQDGIAASLYGGTPSAMVNGALSGHYYQDHSDPETYPPDQSHPDYPDVQVLYSNPEVFGGGERGIMPQFPYLESGTKAWIYGAPDGYKDGVILVLTSGSDSVKF